MSNNPLMQFARRPELSVRLASNPCWYNTGFIEYTMNGEVEVYPMLPKDELSLYNPDALLSGQAMVGLIKSCCPSVLNPEKLYFPDANILLLAIKKATYGNEHKQSHRCPECYRKMEEIRLQKYMAEKLVSLLNRNDFSSIFEIGSATGILTKELIKKVQYKSYTLNDIVPNSEK